MSYNGDNLRPTRTGAIRRHKYCYTQLTAEALLESGDILLNYTSHRIKIPGGIINPPALFQLTVLSVKQLIDVLYYVNNV